MKVRYTVPSAVTRAAYAGNGVTTNFSAPFNFYDDSDLDVVLVNNASGVETIQVLTTNYTVTGGDGESGSITMLVAPPSGNTLVIERDIPFTQEIDLEPNDPFPAEVTEEGFDRATMLAQQNRLEIQKSPKLPPTYDPDSDPEIRIPVPEAGKILIGNDDEDGWDNGTIADLSTSIDTVFASLVAGDFIRYNGTTWANNPGEYYSLRFRYGAVPDCISLPDSGAITATATTLSHATYDFAAGDVGKKVFVDGAGAAGGTLETTIASVAGGNATLTLAASTTVANAAIIFGTDNTTALQNAFANSSNRYTGGRTIFCEAGNYLFDGTLTAPPYSSIFGEAKEQVLFTRAGDFGPSIKCGDSVSLAAGAFQLHNIFLVHGSPYTSGDTRLKFPVANASSFHVQLYGGQQAIIQDCIFWRLKRAISVHGGSVFHFDKNTMLGVYDHEETDCQEGERGLSFEKDTTHGNPKDLWAYGNSFLGAVSAARTVDINGTPVASFIENISTIDFIHIEALETATFLGNFIGGANNSGITLDTGVASNVSNIRVLGNFFDSARFADIIVSSQSTAVYARGLTIVGNQFNGEYNGYKGIDIRQNGSTPTLYGFEIADNYFNAHFGSCVTIAGGFGGSVHDNIMADYNTENLGAADLQYITAMWVTGSSKKVVCSNNSVGGGGNQFANAGTVDNHCEYGIVIDSTPAINGCYQVGTHNLGVDNLTTVAAPAVPASTVTAQNATGEYVDVYITGGTYTTVTVNGTALGSVLTSVGLSPGSTIAITYTVAPTWTWISRLR